MVLKKNSKFKVYVQILHFCKRLTIFRTIQYINK